MESEETYKVILERFRKTIDDDFQKILSEFWERGEHSNITDTLEAKCDRLVSDRIISLCLESEPASLNAAVFLSTIEESDLPAGGWVMSVAEEVLRCLHLNRLADVKEAIENNEENKEILDEAIRKSNPLLMSASEYMILKSNNLFNQLNRNFVNLVFEACVYLYLKKSVEGFYANLKAKGRLVSEVFRAITVPEPKEYLKSFLGNQIDRGLLLNN